MLYNHHFHRDIMIIMVKGKSVNYGKLKKVT